MLTREEIKRIALANGFKLKKQPDGSLDLNPYVYECAEALLATKKFTSNLEERDIDIDDGC